MKEKAPKRYEKWLNKHVSPLHGRHVLITGGISGYPHRTKFCRNVRRQVKTVK